jgi:hypothetical protein
VHSDDRDDQSIGYVCGQTLSPYFQHREGERFVLIRKKKQIAFGFLSLPSFLFASKLGSCKSKKESHYLLLLSSCPLSCLLLLLSFSFLNELDLVDRFCRCRPAV